MLLDPRKTVKSSSDFLRKFGSRVMRSIIYNADHKLCGVDPNPLLPNIVWYGEIRELKPRSWEVSRSFDLPFSPFVS